MHTCTEPLRAGFASSQTKEGSGAGGGYLVLWNWESEYCVTKLTLTSHLGGIEELKDNRWRIKTQRPSLLPKRAWISSCGQRGTVDGWSCTEQSPGKRTKDNELHGRKYRNVRGEKEKENESRCRENARKSCPQVANAALEGGSEQEGWSWGLLNLRCLQGMPVGLPKMFMWWGDQIQVSDPIQEKCTGSRSMGHEIRWSYTGQFGRRDDFREPTLSWSNSAWEAWHGPHNLFNELWT